MDKIAILTLFYKNYNYGGVLQGYALTQVLNSLGYSSEIIAYDNGLNQNPIYKNLKEQCCQYSLSEAITKVIEKSIEKLTFLIKCQIQGRKQLFERFIERNVTVSQIYNDFTIKLCVNEYIAFISGSDQVWNPNSIRKLYLQEFVNDEKLKISYAASISRDKLSSKEAEIIVSCVKRFNAISVREKTAQKILDDFGISSVTVTLDPTLLLNDKQWNTVASDRIEPEKYVVCYFFSNSYKYRKQINKFCNDKKLKMLFIPYAKQKFNLSDGIGSGNRMDDIGPAEFLALIRDAEYVFTDSFHGAVFSIIYRKEFVVYERDKDGGTSKNSRLYDLLDIFKLKNQLINGNVDLLKKLSVKIDYKSVKLILENQKKNSIEFLKESLLSKR